MTSTRWLEQDAKAATPRDRALGPRPRPGTRRSLGANRPVSTRTTQRSVRRSASSVWPGKTGNALHCDSPRNGRSGNRSGVLHQQATEAVDPGLSRWRRTPRCRPACAYASNWPSLGRRPNEHRRGGGGVLSAPVSRPVSGDRCTTGSHTIALCCTGVVIQTEHRSRNCSSLNVFCEPVHQPSRGTPQ